MVDELSSIAYIDPEFNNDKEKEIKEAEEFLDKHKKYIQNIKLNKYSIGIKKKFYYYLHQVTKNIQSILSRKNMAFHGKLKEIGK